MPIYSERFKRSTLTREGGSLDIYAAWFKNQFALWPKQIFSINDISLNAEIFSKQNNKKNFNSFLKIDQVIEDPAFFNKKGASALLAALENPLYSQNIKQELYSLLFPGEKKVKEQELQAVIKEISSKKACHE
jgi:hypothetical protein